MDMIRKCLKFARVNRKGLTVMKVRGLECVRKGHVSRWSVRCGGRLKEVPEEIKYRRVLERGTNGESVQMMGVFALTTSLAAVQGRSRCGGHKTRQKREWEAERNRM